VKNCLYQLHHIQENTNTQKPEVKKETSDVADVADLFLDGRLSLCTEALE